MLSVTLYAACGKSVGDNVTGGVPIIPIDLKRVKHADWASRRDPGLHIVETKLEEIPEESELGNSGFWSADCKSARDAIFR